MPGRPFSSARTVKATRLEKSTSEKNSSLASQTNSGTFNIRLTDWMDHRSRPLWTLCCKRSRHRSPDPGDGFLPSRHEIGGAAACCW